MNAFKGRHFKGEVVLWAVRWYCRYGVSYRDLEQMMAERGVSVDHTTIYRWVQRYAPDMKKRLRWQWRRPKSRSSRLDETDVKSAADGRICTECSTSTETRSIFYLSPKCNAKAAKRFLAKALKILKVWEHPTVLNTDKAPTYGDAIRALKPGGQLADACEHRQCQYLNNGLEADHGKLKLLIRPVRVFKSMKTAYATIKGVETMRALRKGQADAFNIHGSILGKKRLVERAFGLGPSALADASERVNRQLANA